MLVVSLAFASVARADDADIEFFEKKIRPLLVQHCAECHAADSKKLGGGLLLDSRDGVRKGGESGAAIVSGKPDESLLIKAIRYSDDNLKMPPKGKLPAAAIADLEEWIKRGAPDSRDKPTAPKLVESWEETMRQRARWWSLQAVQKPVVPQPKLADWSAQPIDRFMLAKLEQQGLAPAAAADPRTLARRLSLVLTGLPPSTEQVEQFVRDSSVSGKALAAGETSASETSASEKLVDELLASPQFGERWSRHWLDVVRFTETHGNEWNYEVHHAWRYRDYLTRAFNADVPYDQFIREHIAGDLLPQPRWNAVERFNESIIGTGFYRFGEVNHDDCISLPSLGYDIIDNQIDTLTKAFQATTVACARCHNHKLDAVSMQDYYGLLGILRSSRLVSHCIDGPEVNAALRQRLVGLKTELRKELAAVWLEELGASQSGSPRPGTSRRERGVGGEGPANAPKKPLTPTLSPEYRGEGVKLERLAQYLLAATAQRAKRPDAEVLAKGLDAKRLEKWVALLAVEKSPIEEPFEVWRVLAATDSKAFATEWPKLAERYLNEDRERAEFNQKNFVTFGDFRAVGSDSDRSHARQSVGNTSSDSHALASVATSWHIAGQALQTGLGRSGDFALHPDGDALVRAVLPAGAFTHALSDKLTGTLRSPVLPLGKSHISFQVLGQRSSAVRLVSNNCQLNYKNYRALTSSDLHWETFAPPPDRDSLRTYAELMTMFDNPKFPDQLSALGGDGANYKLPWEKAAENPRSFFGVTRVVLHDGGQTPKPELTHLRPLFRGIGILPVVSVEAASDPRDLADLATRYAAVIEAAVKNFANDQATDDDARWIDALLRRELLANQVASSPRLAELTKSYRQTESELALPRVIAGVGESGSRTAQPIFARGDCQRPGEVAPHRYLEVLASAPIAGEGSGRLAVAEQIASPLNPLTARVMVNRVWHHLFGAGLVRSVDDFGHVGDLPSHPELLDHLATRFVEDGWSMKRLIRSLVLTRTFQMSNQPSASARELDPLNRWLQHYPARRLEAEAIRDSILASSGRLDRTLFGMSVPPFRDKDYADRRLFAGPLDGNGRRSLYTRNTLMERPRFLEAFNFPGGKVAQGRRDVTNVPAQALALLNDPFVLQQADVWAARLVARSSDSSGSRIESMFQTALSRPPSESERNRFEVTVQELANLHQVPASSVLTSSLVWRDVAHAMFNLKEFIYIP